MKDVKKSKVGLASIALLFWIHTPINAREDTPISSIFLRSECYASEDVQAHIVNNSDSLLQVEVICDEGATSENLFEAPAHSSHFCRLSFDEPGVWRVIFLFKKEGKIVYTKSNSVTVRPRPWSRYFPAIASVFTILLGGIVYVYRERKKAKDLILIRKRAFINILLLEIELVAARSYSREVLEPTGILSQDSDIFAAGLSDKEIRVFVNTFFRVIDDHNTETSDASDTRIKLEALANELEKSA